MGMHRSAARSKIPGRLNAPVVRRRPLARPLELLLVGVVLTDIVSRLLDRSRVTAVERATRTRSCVDEQLREFERAWEKATGERLTTAAFYDRFRSGHFDTRFGARWATCYEATLARPAASA
jgi:hypothetical protein